VQKGIAICGHDGVQKGIAKCGHDGVQKEIAKTFYTKFLSII
jgi:hypothetical protein